MRRVIFVFGSNLKGIHGAGAAKFAADHYGAQHRVGEGIAGDSYALPTCKAPGVPMELEDVAHALRRFRDYANAHPDCDFLLTAIGCGLAGFATWEINQILPHLPSNVYIQAKLAQEQE